MEGGGRIAKGKQRGIAGGGFGFTFGGREEEQSRDGERRQRKRSGFSI